MMTLYSKCKFKPWTPGQALKLAKKVVLNSHADRKIINELEKFVFDVPPSQRDDLWAAQVQTFIESNFTSLPSQKASIEAKLN